jgi:hypothetical protein
VSRTYAVMQTIQKCVMNSCRAVTIVRGLVKVGEFFAASTSAGFVVICSGPIFLDLWRRMAVIEVVRRIFETA